jgi:hypothetical protein
MNPYWTEWSRIHDAVAGSQKSTGHTQHFWSITLIKFSITIITTTNATTFISITFSYNNKIYAKLDQYKIKEPAKYCFVGWTPKPFKMSPQCFEPTWATSKQSNVIQQEVSEVLHFPTTWQRNRWAETCWRHKKKHKTNKKHYKDLKFHTNQPCNVKLTQETSSGFKISHISAL